MKRYRPLLLAALFLPACEIISSGIEDPILEPEVLELPAFAGPFKVGTTSIVVVDDDRDDEYTPETDARELNVKLWYPADQEGLGTVSYAHPTVIDLFSVTQDYAPPEQLGEQFSRISTGTTAGAPITSVVAQLPVVFWSHGLGGVNSLYTTYAAELASQGFLVVGIDHTYGAFVTVFPDGAARTIKLGNASPPFPEVVRIWARDMASVLDHLEGLNTNDPDGLLTGRIDLSRVGAIGHSTGGSAAADVHTFDDRFSAAITLDAPEVGEAAEGVGVDDPMMLFFAEASEYASTAVSDRLQGPGYSLTVSGTSHYSFTDLPVLLELANVPIADRQASNRPPGTIDPNRNLALINAWSFAFFDRYLRGGAAPLLDSGAIDWPEVALTRVGAVGVSLP